METLKLKFVKPNKTNQKWGDRINKKARSEWKGIVYIPFFTIYHEITKVELYI